MSEFAPVATLEDLDSLDETELMNGYMSALSGDSEPGNNHTRAFWHGWRNGAMDRGILDRDAASDALARAWFERERLRCGVEIVHHAGGAA